VLVHDAHVTGSTSLPLFCSLFFSLSLSLSLSLVLYSTIRLGQASVE
jgi:hypothetical protein